MQRFRQFILFGLIFIFSACSSTLWLSDTEIANTISEPARLKIKNYKAGQFIVHGRERYDKPGNDLNIYLEGDGLAWVSRREPSRDPTPDNPIGLRLAAIDPAPNVIWLARPCQYTCLLYTSPSPRDRQKSRMPSSA